MKPQLTGIVLVVGAYGSGKTEVSINLALTMRRGGESVRLVDLDLVNPYFRTREARNVLQKQGIDVVLPPDAYLYADLPILSPVVSGVLKRPVGLTVLDVGGDDVGATVLAALADSLSDREKEVLMVINPHRPHTDTVQGCLTVKRQIEAKAKLSVTGIVGNANLMDQTTAIDVETGYAFCREVAEKAKLRLLFVTTPTALLTRLEKKAIQCPILPINRYLTFPWQNADAPGGRGA